MGTLERGLEKGQQGVCVDIKGCHKNRKVVLVGSYYRQAEKKALRVRAGSAARGPRALQ